MFHIEVDTLIKRLDEFYRFFGVWRNKDTHVVRKLSSYSLLIIGLGFIVALISRAVSSDSKDESLFLVATSLYIIIIMIRNNNFRYKREQFMTLLYDNCSHSFANERDFIRVNKRVTIFLNLALFFIVMTGVPVPIFSLGILPAFSKVKALPFNVGYNLNWKDNNSAYVVAYACCVIALLYTIATTCITILVWYLMIGFSIQYDNLGFRLRDMGARRRTTSNNKEPIEKENLFHRDLIELIQLHRRIFKNVNEFKSLCSYIFFVQIMTSGICICGSIYTIINASREIQWQLIVYFTQMCYGIFDIFMLMYLGNDIKLSSNQLSYYVFESNWIQQPKKTKKCFIILTENLKQPHELMIYKLYPLNLQTFTSILRLAYSMFNILRNI